MKISAQMVNEASFKKEIAKFEKLTGRGIDAGVKQIAESTGRALASKVRPYGMSAKKGAEFQKNIQEQIRHVRYGVNVGAYSGSSIQEATEAQRRRGRVRIRRITGSGWNNTISKGEAEAYARRQAQKAGIAKAGWVEATNKATGMQLKRVPSWVKRHLGKGYGSGTMRRVGAKTTLDLATRVKYASQAQSSGEIASALRQGRKNALKFMMRQINKSTSKIK